MAFSASPAVVSVVAISTGLVISSATGMALGSRPLSATLRSTSRSVKMPVTRCSLSTTATAPTCRSTISRIAAATLVSGVTEAGVSSHICSSFMHYLHGFTVPPGIIRACRRMFKTDADRTYFIPSARRKQRTRKQAALSGEGVEAFEPAGAVASDQFVQVVAVGAVFAERFMVEKALCAAVGAYAIRIVLVVTDGPRQARVPAAAQKHCPGGAHTGGSNAKRPEPFAMFLVGRHLRYLLW